MKILFLAHSFNSLAQRLYIELTRRGHEVSIEFDINDAVTAQAVELYHPELITKSAPGRNPAQMLGRERDQRVDDYR
jgi:putative two-component system hydrogenase maturation factor HypX/HoxX